MRDLSNQKEFSSGGILEDGDYVAHIEESELTTSQNGHAMIKVVFNINGAKIYDYLVLEGEDLAVEIGLSKARSILSAIGCKNFKFPNDRAMSMAMVGSLMVSITSKEDTYQGHSRMKNQIKKYFPLPMGTAKKIPQQYDNSSIPF